MLAPRSARSPLAGACLCGGARFEITVPFGRANQCHCSRCRKHSGTFVVPDDGLPRHEAANPGADPEMR